MLHAHTLTHTHTVLPLPSILMFGFSLTFWWAVLARFIWTPFGDDRARWEQAFSADEGASWETNWIMEFERRRA